jgi:hypothetical protein
VLACIACAVGCGFESGSAGIDAADGEVPIDAVVIDTAPPDAAGLLRTRAELIGLWEFDEAGGTTINDTSDAPVRLPLAVSVGSVTFAASTMTPNGVALIQSAPSPHLNADVIGAQAVTLEAWVMPATASQGTIAAPVLVAGLSSNINSRNIALMQAGTRWVARVRTTGDVNGKPDLMSTTDVTPGVMTHIVVVADATQRILYVDSQAQAIDPAPAAPLGWDRSYRMLLGNEISQGRQWAGTFALVAMYRSALSKELLDTNFKAGPNGK